MGIQGRKERCVYTYVVDGKQGNDKSVFWEWFYRKIKRGERLLIARMSKNLTVGSAVLPQL
jgi:hypothetical protein